MAQEEWRPIPGYEGRYEASSLGRIRSLPNGCHNYPLVRKTHVGPQGYDQIVLHKDGKRTHLNVHWLIAAAFLGPRPAGMDIRHLDGDKLNNSIANLVYGTRSENIRDIVRHGRHHNANKTHCVRNHELTGENMRVYTHPETGKQRRICRACMDLHRKGLAA